MSGSNFSVPGARADAQRAEPLDFTVHTLPEPRVDDQRRRSGRAKMLLILLVCALPVLASYFAYYVVRPGTSSAYSTLIQPSVALPDVAGRTLDGRSVPLRSLQGQWLLIALGGGACDVACEKRLYMQRQLREMTGRERERIDKLWLVIDEAPVAAPLQAALAAAPATLVLRVPRAVVAGWLRPAAGHALEQHLYVVDPMGEWMMRAPPEPDPKKLERDLERLLRASAGWDQPGRATR